jgi:hypothetical protein
MKRWIIFAVFSVFLSYPAVSDAGDSLFDTGKSTMFNYPFMQIPIGGTADPNKDKKDEKEAKKDPEQEKKVMDKKVDDAIKKAWGDNQ